MRILEKARVLSVEGGRAEVVMTEPAEAAKCSSCKMASACATRERRFTVDAPEGVNPGDEVTVEMDVPSPVTAALLVFMLPLATAFLAGGLTYRLTRSEAAGLAGGLVGAATVYLVIYLTRLGSRTAGRVVGAGGETEGAP